MLICYLLKIDTNKLTGNSDPSDINSSFGFHISFDFYQFSCPQKTKLIYYFVEYINKFSKNSVL